MVPLLYCHTPVLHTCGALKNIFAASTSNDVAVVSVLKHPKPYRGKYSSFGRKLVESSLGSIFLK
eukprot:12251985-Ditylum_brightwellii.AAC.1